MAEVSIEGFDNLLKILQDLGNEDVVNKYLKKANQDILRGTKKEMQSGLPFPASLKRGIGVRAALINGTRHPNAVVVGPTSDVYPMRFLNTGTVDRYTKSGAYRGKIVGNKAMEPFLDSKARGIQDDAVNMYGESLVKITAKDVKKINKNK